ncbi:hypothetical protein EDD85DRAFT_797169 [Armillaria nabsnona]|nr:hypothetical protein EDD85DRAFT_797169 [Armillaria nabsnona]
MVYLLSVLNVFEGVLVDSHLRDEESANDVELTEELILTPAVNKDDLLLPVDRKDLLQSLVEPHHRELGFDNFIKSKGYGLVINLFGPPGVDETISGERPLYLVGAGDLGTDMNSLDMAFKRVFEVPTTWKAIVLIDEADVYLKQRSLHDLVWNPMVAVLLRHVEYYHGILFLTTNRTKAFDDIPVAYSRWGIGGYYFAAYPGTGEAGHEWQADQECGEDSAVVGCGLWREASFKHFLSTLDAMNDFTKEVIAVQK